MSDRMTVHRREYYVQNSGLPHNLTIEQPDTLRFEVRAGNAWSGEHDKERSEIAGVDAFTDRVTIRFEFSVEASPVKNSAQWLLIGQWRQSQKAPPGSPPFALELEGEDFRVVIRKTPQDFMKVYSDPTFRRERWYWIRIEAKFDPENGELDIFRDGDRIVDYRGPLGFYPEPKGGYWKSGVYRSAAAEPFVLRVRGLEVW